MSRFKVLSLILIVIYVVAAIATSVTLSSKQIDDMKKKAKAVGNSAGGKDMAGYIAEIWPTKIVPEFEKEAIELEQVEAGLKADAEAYGKKHGRRNNDFSPRNYIVKGKGVVKAVNTKSPAGKIVLDIKDLSGKKDVIIQIGPVIKKSAVRDSLSFISFNDFVNQIEFGEVSKEIKSYIIKNIVNNVKEKDLVGKEIEFLGAFSYDKRGKILISPVKISVEGK